MKVRWTLVTIKNRPNFMNIHVPEEIRKRFPAWEFRGVPFYDKNGKKWIRAKSKIFYKTWYYSFDDGEIYDTIY